MQEPAPSVFAAMKESTPLLKYGRKGKPHFRMFRLSPDRTLLRWHSDKTKKKPTEVRIQNIVEVLLGRQTELFRNSSSNHPANLCFSIVYTQEGSSENQTLDLVCKDPQEYEIWTKGFLWLAENKDKLGSAPRHVVGEGEEEGGLDVEEQKLIDTDGLREQAMKEQSDLYTWGESHWGECGHAEDPDECGVVSQPRPVRSLVEKDLNITSIACGEHHTIAVTKEGSVYAWGHSGNGRLGVGIKAHVCDHYTTPVLVEALSGVSIMKVAASFSNSMFVTVDGVLYACGANNKGQVGCNNPDDFSNHFRGDHYTPVAINLPGPVIDCAMGMASSFAVVLMESEEDDPSVRQGRVFSWGANDYGVLGHGDTEDRDTPCHVDGIHRYFDVKTVDAGMFHACVIADATHPHALLTNKDGDEEEDSRKPRRTTRRSTSFKRTSGWSSASWAYNRKLLSWGLNSSGQLGHGDTSDRHAPVLVEMMRTKITETVYCGDAHTAALVSMGVRGENLSGQLFVWGSAPCVLDQMQLMTGGTNMEDVLVPRHLQTDNIGDKYENICCGDTFILALTSDNTLKEFGLAPASLAMVDISDYVVKNIDCGASHVVALFSRKWIDDEDCLNCMGCNSAFSTFVRRHHCRSCGGIFCGKCTSKRAPVLKYGYDTPTRVCDTCYRQIMQGDEEGA